MAKITLTEYAALHKLTPAAVSRKAKRGGLPHEKFHGLVLIEETEPYVKRKPGRKGRN